MKPDMRPLSVLTVDILQSSEWWMIVCNDYTDTRRSSAMILYGDALETPYEIYVLDDDSIQCSPATRDEHGRPNFSAWPMLEGEEEIERFRNATLDQWELVRVTDWAGGWALKMLGEYEITIDLKDGYHPAPRQGGKWVWEADQ